MMMTKAPINSGENTRRAGPSGGNARFKVWWEERKNSNHDSLKILPPGKEGQPQSRFHEYNTEFPSTETVETSIYLPPPGLSLSFSILSGGLPVHLYISLTTR